MLLPCLLLVATLVADPPATKPDQIRPVDPTGRAQLGFPPPRAPDTILADLDALTPPDHDGPDQHNDITPADWDAWQLGNNERATRRISLIAELEESGYDGPRLHPLLYVKLLDAALLTQHASTPLRDSMAVMWSVRDRYRNTPIAGRAALFGLTRAIVSLRRAGLHVSEADLQTIADAEQLAAGDPDNLDVGYTLTMALEDHPQPVKDKWLAWADENLPADSLIKRTAARRAAFDQPIRLEGPSLDGGLIDTNDWLGSVVLVDFWGTWCGPCKARMPELDRLRKTYGDRGLRIVGILADRPEPAQRYLKEKGYDWPQIIAKDIGPEREDIFRHPIVKQYAVNSFPTLWIIDRDGILRKAPWDEKELEARILELIEKPAAPRRP